MTAASDERLAHAVAGWLPEARWYAGDGRSGEQVTIEGRVWLAERADEPLELAVVRIGIPGVPGGEAARYSVPVRWTSAGPVDAAVDPRLAGWLARAAAAGLSLRSDRGMLLGMAAGEDAAEPAAAAGHEPALDVVAAGGDASNTSVMVRPLDGGPAAVVVKLLRRIREGIQPEVELGMFFRESGWRETPRLVGSVAWAHGGQPPAVIATVHELAEGMTGLWDRLVTRLAADAGETAGWQESLDLAAATGRTTARMHRVLTSRPDLAAFAAEPWTSEAADRAGGAMLAHATEVLAKLAAAADQLPEAFRPRIGRLLADRGRLLETLNTLAGRRWLSPRIRVHGDYHLGQLLVGGGRLLVIDFEGEPSRPLAARREKQSPAKDIAGMLRSFDYLANVALAPRQPAEAVAAAAARLGEAFLQAYREEADGGDFWPDAAEASQLLAIHTLDKAIYELAYELDHRPGWIGIPLTAIERMIR